VEFCILISNVLADRTVTKSAMAKKFEIVEGDWMNIETLVTLLKPLQIITTVLSSEKHSPVSMVRPLMFKLIEKHLKIKENDAYNYILTYNYTFYILPIGRSAVFMTSAPCISILCTLLGI